MKVLVVDDEINICKMVQEFNQFVGNEVQTAYNGMEAIELCRQNQFDVVIMDIMMPKLDGFGAVKEIRKFSSVPIIMLSARGEEYDKLYGFELGIDDYLVKPFSLRELIARQNAIINRENIKSRRIESFEGLEIDFDGRNVRVDGKKLSMTNKEMEVLFYLVRNKGIAISRERLLTSVWDFDYLGDDRTVDTHIKMLREKLGKYRNFVVTVRGVGYKFDEKD